MLKLRFKVYKKSVVQSCDERVSYNVSMVPTYDRTHHNLNKSAAEVALTGKFEIEGLKERNFDLFDVDKEVIITITDPFAPDQEAP